MSPHNPDHYRFRRRLRPDEWRGLEEEKDPYGWTGWVIFVLFVALTVWRILS